MKGGDPGTAPAAGAGADTTDDNPLPRLITTYYDLNGHVIDELDEEPSPLEFMRYVARNTPFVARRAAASWPAVKTWDAVYLRRELAAETVNIAVTPNGSADAPTRRAGGDVVFAKPWQEQQPFPDFLDHIIRQEKSSEEGEVRYAQTQDDNLRDEYVPLLPAVAADIPFARIALQLAPEAVNLWIGNSRSVTALHKDNYENIYVQIRGRKHFVLLPPLCSPCVNERPLRPAHYVRPRRDEGHGGGGSGRGRETPAAAAVALELELEDGGDDVPFALWDPDRPEADATPYSALARPIRVTLDPGDMLYLPAMWYHKVSQSCADDGICVAANYWYDMDFMGPSYALDFFVRSVYSRMKTDENQTGARQ